VSSQTTLFVIAQFGDDSFVDHLMLMAGGTKIPTIRLEIGQDYDRRETFIGGWLVLQNTIGQVLF